MNPQGYLLRRLAELEQRIRLAVALRREHDPSPDDPYRGLYLSDEYIDGLLVRQEPRLNQHPRWQKSPGTDLGSRDESLLRALTRNFELTALDVDLLLLALAADVDPRFESFFGYLNDDVTRRRPSIAVALQLCGASLADPQDRARLVDGPLLRRGLLRLDDVERPFPGRALHVPDRVVEHLLGGSSPDPALAPVMVSLPELDWGSTAELKGALGAGVTLFYLRERPTASAGLLAKNALRAAGYGAVVLDAARFVSKSEATELVTIAAREARLTGAGLVIYAVEELAGDGRIFAAADCAPMPLLLIGRDDWDPRWLERPPLQLTVAPSTGAERLGIWRQELGDAPGAAQIDFEAATVLFQLRPEQIVRASAAALIQRHLVQGQPVEGQPVQTGRLHEQHIKLGARAENAAGLDKLARRIEPGVGWVDLVLPDPVFRPLQEVVMRARFREKVLGEWRMRPGSGRGRGVAALFAGDSGTGKTMSAEVVAGALGLDLYVVDLSTVVDKYVGETEKNLERIFSAAAGVNGVLLFDEADAIFGKRSDVKDAHDRYANIESAYLLQRMESFDGLAILATNLRSNIDDAFTRRLDVLIDFPMPDAEHRAKLWDRCLGGNVRRAADVDVAFLGEAFELSGGAIRSATVTAAYFAAEDGGELQMAHLIRAVHSEYRKMGRLTLESEFRHYWHLVGRAS